MKTRILVTGAFLGLLAALVLADGAGAVDPASVSPLLERSLQYERVLTTPSGFSLEQRRLLAITLAAAESQTTDPAELLAVYRQLDALVTYLLMSDTSFTWDGAQWTGTHRTTYAYGSGNRLAVEIEEDYEATGWVNSSRQTYSYDGEGRLSTSVWQDWDTTTSDWVDQFQYIYTYDGSGNMTEMLAQTWDNGWDNASKTTMYYSAGRIDSSVTEAWDSGDWVNASKTTYTYDGADRLSVWLSQFWAGSDWINSLRITSTYDVNGWEIQAVTQHWPLLGVDWVNAFKSDYYYDGTGNQILWVHWSWVDPQWTATEADTMKYAGNKLIEEVRYGILPPSLSRSQYSYDGYGNHVESIDQDWVVTEWVNTSRDVYIYALADVRDNVALQPAGFGVEQNYPNPFNGPTVIAFNAETSRPAAVEIYNILGQQVFARRLESVVPGRQYVTWDGCDLSGRPAPSGLYLYRVTVDGTQQTRKMVLLK